MSNTIETTKSAVVGRVETVAKLAVVKDHATGVYEEYPASQVTYTGSTGIQQQNVTRFYTHTFRIEVFFEQGSNFSPEKVELLMIKTADQLITVFDNDNTLGGAVQDVTPANLDAGFETRELDVRTLTMDLEVRILINQE